MSTRGTAVQIAAQVADAQDMLSQAVPRRKITRYLRDRYGLGERTARRRVEQAVDLMTKQAQAIDRTELAAQLFAIYETLIHDAQKARQFNASLGAANGLAKLAGLIDRPSRD